MQVIKMLLHTIMLNTGFSHSEWLFVRQWLYVDTRINLIIYSWNYTVALKFFYLQANYELSNKLVLFKKHNWLPKQLGNLLNELSLLITKYKIKVHSFVSIKSYN